jgi:hypothetical protein
LVRRHPDRQLVGESLLLSGKRVLGWLTRIGATKGSAGPGLAARRCERLHGVTALDESPVEQLARSTRIRLSGIGR